MLIARQHLIELCNNFLDDKIDKLAIQNFAWNALTNDNLEWEEDDIISTTIFEWDNEGINYEINKVNILLWKNRLQTGNDELITYNVWNSHIEMQKNICKKYDSTWNPVNRKLRVGVSSKLENDPIHGLRHPSELGTTGWFIWTGEYSRSDDFFQPICAEHLVQLRPDIIKYLGLDVCFRFLADKNGFEDVWYDGNLINI